MDPSNLKSSIIIKENIEECIKCYEEGQQLDVIIFESILIGNKQFVEALKYFDKVLCQLLNEINLIKEQRQQNQEQSVDLEQDYLNLQNFRFQVINTKGMALIQNLEQLKIIEANLNQDAVKCYEQMLRLSQQNFNVQGEIPLNSSKMKNYRMRITIVQKQQKSQCIDFKLKLKPYDFEAFVSKGDILKFNKFLKLVNEQQKFQEAIQWYDSAIFWNESDPTVQRYFKFYLFFTKKDDTLKKVNVYSFLISISPIIFQNKLEDAKSCFQISLDLKPDYFEALDALGCVLLNQQDWLCFRNERLVFRSFKVFRQSAKNKKI